MRATTIIILSLTPSLAGCQLFKSHADKDGDGVVSEQEADEAVEDAASAANYILPGAGAVILAAWGLYKKTKSKPEPKPEEPA